MKIEKYQMSIDDCTKLISQFNDKDQSQRIQLIEIYHRRAKCYGFIKEYEKSLSDYTWICDHENDTTKIREEMENLISVKKCFEKMKKIEEIIKSGDKENGIEQYSSILNILPNFIPYI